MSELLLTKESADKIRAEINELKNKKMPEIIKRLEDSIKLGDLSENGEYQAAKEDQGMTAGRIRELEQKLSFARIVERENVDCVSIGSTITVVDDGGKERTMTIVDQTQADPAGGKISNESPLGLAFIGKCAGHEVEVELPAGLKKFTIKKVS